MLIEIFSFLWNLLRHIVWIFEKDSPISKKDLLRNYFSLKITYIFLEKLLRKNQKNVKIFGLNINCADLNTVIRLYEEIFINNIYYFKTKNKTPLILDCGGHMGMSVIYFKIVYPKAKIIVFEPEKQTFLILQKNVRQNKFKDITLINKAVYSRNGPLILYFKQNDPTSGTGGISPRENYLPEKIPAVVLSKYIKGKVDFAKIDIEGAEINVFEELAKTKRLRHIQKLCLEYHHHLNPKEDKLSKLLSILEKNNFGYLINSYFPSNSTHKKIQDVIIYAYQKL